jgi:hypothetical protein
MVPLLRSTWTAIQPGAMGSQKVASRNVRTPAMVGAASAPSAVSPATRRRLDRAETSRGESHSRDDRSPEVDERDLRPAESLSEGAKGADQARDVKGREGKRAAEQLGRASCVVQDTRQRADRSATTTVSSPQPLELPTYEVASVRWAQRDVDDSRSNEIDLGEELRGCVR